MARHQYAGKSEGLVGGEKIRKRHAGERKKTDEKSRCLISQSTTIDNSSQGGHLNTYELAELKCQREVCSKETALREHLKGHYDRRITFDSSIDNGEKLRYGALFIGGCGATHYGHFCLVMKQEFINSDNNFAFVKSDSLNTARYWHANILVKQEFCQDLATSENVCALAAIKHSDRVPSCTGDQWESLISDGVDFIEAIFMEKIDSRDVEKVMIAKNQHQAKSYLSLKIAWGTIEVHERILFEAFGKIKEHLETQGIPLELIDHV